MAILVIKFMEGGLLLRHPHSPISMTPTSLPSISDNPSPHLQWTSLMDEKGLIQWRPSDEERSSFFACLQEQDVNGRLVQLMSTEISSPCGSC